jgi:predicted transcriptional regulator
MTGLMPYNSEQESLVILITNWGRPMSATVPIELDDETQQRVQTLAKSRNRSPHSLLHTAVLEFLAREEAYEQENAEDAVRWERYTRGEAVDHGAVLEWLDGVGTDNERPCPR